MRYVVLIFGLVGAVGSGFIGYQWMDGFNHEKVDMAEIRPLAHTGFFKSEALGKIAEFDRRAKAWPFLLTGAVLGLLGCLLAFERRRFSGSALLLCAALGPVVFNPPVAIFTFGLVLAGLLALFIRPLSATVGPANKELKCTHCAALTLLPASPYAEPPEPAEETNRPDPSLAMASAAEKTSGQEPPATAKPLLATSGSEEPNPKPYVSKKTQEAGLPEKAIQPGPGEKSKSPPASSESVSEEANSRGRNSEKCTSSRKGFDLLGLGVAAIVVAYLCAFGASYYGLIGYHPDEIPAPNPSPKGGKENPIRGPKGGKDNPAPPKGKSNLP